MKQICINDPSIDVSPFVPGLSTDLSKALESGQVVAGDASINYNGVSDPADVIGRVRDSFDAVDAFNRLSSSASQSNPEQGASE